MDLRELRDSQQSFPFELIPHWLREIVEVEGRLTISQCETAKLYGVSRGSVRQAIKNGELPVLHLGCRVLLPVIPLLQILGVDVLSDLDPSRPGDGASITRSMNGLS